MKYADSLRIASISRRSKYLTTTYETTVSMLPTSRPSHVASEYVFGKFYDVFIDPDGMLALRAGRKLSERAAHRPLVADSAAARRFDEETRRLISEWQESNPLMLTPSEI